MKAARLHQPGKVHVEEVPVPNPSRSQVLIKVERAGICGTDIGVLHGYVPAKLPVTMGHEFAGTVAVLGSPGLGGLKVGDAVFAAGGWGCGECEFCRQGAARFCRQRRALGRTVDGCFAEYVIADCKVVWKMPPGVSLDEAQNFLNVSVVLHALKKARHPLAARAVVFGAGNIGLVATQVLNLAGASEIVMVGTRDSRLDLARRFGAKHSVNVRNVNPVSFISSLWPDGADLVIEATGDTGSFASACQVIRPGGEMISIGVFSQRIKELDLSFLYAREAAIYGSSGGEDGYEDAISLLGGRKLSIAPMITHRFTLEDAPRALATFEDKSADAARIVIQPFC